MNPRKIAIAYIPVIHEGYRKYMKLLEGEGVEELYLVADEILESHEALDYIHRKDRLRALPHEEMKRALAKLTTLPIASLTMSSILELQTEHVAIRAPREDINRFLIETYFGGHLVTYHDVFVRRHKENIGEKAEPNTAHVSLTDFEKEVFVKAIKESEHSADWWRQVGAALVRDGKVIFIAHNEHMPEEELPNIEGDARSLFKKGVHVNYVTSAHAEASVIAQAARVGIPTEGATLFTTDFPCPYCARVIAKAGIKKMYYLTGYAVLGGDDFMRDMDIEAVRVDLGSIQK